MREDGRLGNLSASAVTLVPSTPTRIPTLRLGSSLGEWDRGASWVEPQCSVSGAGGSEGTGNARAKPPGKAGGRVGREGRGTA